MGLKMKKHLLAIVLFFNAFIPAYCFADSSSTSNKCRRLEEKVQYLQFKVDECVRRTSSCKNQLDEMDAAIAVFKECATQHPTVEDPESCRALRYCVTACDRKKVAALNLQKCQSKEDPTWKDQACRSEMKALAAGKEEGVDCK